MSSSSRTAGHIGSRRAAYGLLLGTVVFLALRAMVGWDPQDGSYVVSLARDMAAGSVPLVDEQSLQTFGALWLVPPLWLWRTVVGDTGLILVARECYVLVVALVLLLCFRALRRSFGDLPVAAGLSAAVVALPYAQPVLSYNTGVQLGLIVAVVAGYAAARDASRGWAALAAGGLCVAALSNPAVAPGVVALAVVLVRDLRGAPDGSVGRSSWRGGWRAPALVAFGGTIGTIAAATVVGVLVGPGFAGLRATSEATHLIRPSVGGMIAIWRTLRYDATLLLTGFLAIALVAALVAGSPRVSRRVARAAYALAGLALLASVVRWTPPNTQEPYGLEAFYAGVAGTMICMALAPFLARGWRADPELARLGRRAGLVALVGGLGVQVTTASHAKHGAMPVAFGPLILVSVIAYVAAARGLPGEAAGDGERPEHPGRLRWVAVLPALTAAVALCTVVFEEGPVWQHRERIATGPAAGLWAADATRSEYAAAREAIARCPDGGRDALVIWTPGTRVLLPAGTAGWTAPLTWVDGNDLSRRITGSDRRTVRCVIAPETLQPRMDVAGFEHLVAGMRLSGGPLVVRRSQENVPVPFRVWVR